MPSLSRFESERAWGPLRRLGSGILRGRAIRQQAMDVEAIQKAYRRWAPIYDITFGRIAAEGRRQAVALINEMDGGEVLEVGVGTGLSLPSYGAHLRVTGIDLSTEMLEKARERVAEEGLDHVAGLYEMDAGALEFADDSFDTVVAMYVMTVVPNPERVMRELERVTKPGGEVILINHFSQTHGVRGWVEHGLAPFAEMLGWHPVFPVERVLTAERLTPFEERALKPFGLFTMLRLRKSERAQAARLAEAAE